MIFESIILCKSTSFFSLTWSCDNNPFNLVKRLESSSLVILISAWSGFLLNLQTSNTTNTNKMKDILIKLYNIISCSKLRLTQCKYRWPSKNKIGKVLKLLHQICSEPSQILHFWYIWWHYLKSLCLFKLHLILLNKFEISLASTFPLQLLTAYLWFYSLYTLFQQNIYFVFLNWRV